MKEAFTTSLVFEPQTFERYSELLRELRTRQYPMIGSNIVYPAMGMAGEAGELLDKVKKHWRNTSQEHGDYYGMNPLSLTEKQRLEIVKEMGDVLWYCWAMCEELNISFHTVAATNLRKLADRAKRNKICSEGDNR